MIYDVRAASTERDKRICGSEIERIYSVVFFSEPPLSNVPLHAPALDVATALEQMSHLVCVISVVKGDLSVSMRHACPSAVGPSTRNMLVYMSNLIFSPEPH